MSLILENRPNPGKKSDTSASFEAMKWGNILGGMKKMKNETLENLADLFKTQKHLPFPLLPQEVMDIILTAHYLGHVSHDFHS